MNESTYLWAILGNLATQSPIILVQLAGCIAVVVRWKDMREGALPAILGLGLGLLLALLSPIIWAVLPRMLVERQGTADYLASHAATVYAVVHVATSLLFALAGALVIAGLLRGRTPAPAQPMTAPESGGPERL